MTVAAGPIVEAVNVVRHIGFRQFTILVNLFLDSLLLQAAEEGLRDGVVPAVAFAAHARFQVI